MGWIGVDLDGTLAHYTDYEEQGGKIGAPVPEMVARVRRWLLEGRDVRIFTARVWKDPEAVERKKVMAWCDTYIGVVLPVTCEKDWDMEELWDDRAVRVEKNTGRVISGT